MLTRLGGVLVDSLTMSSKTRDLMDDLLSRAPHCWDGCQLCVMLERGCNYPPFDQPFLVTSRLTADIVRIIEQMVGSPTQVFPLKVGVDKEFQRFLSAARYTVDLISPWLSPEIVRVLTDKSKENDLYIRIITTRDMTNKVHEESIRILREAHNLIDTRISQQFHAKGMLVDSVMLLTGSFNFTTSGINSNVENLTVDFSLQGTKNFRRKFDAIWAESIPLDKL
jgi:phosphatidylserine/phosphatidylglycerophosphate/cardiolipin synthase-like enzyme